MFAILLVIAGGIALASQEVAQDELLESNVTAGIARVARAAEKYEVQDGMRMVECGGFGRGRMRVATGWGGVGLVGSG